MSVSSSFAHAQCAWWVSEHLCFQSTPFPPDSLSANSAIVKVVVPAVPPHPTTPLATRSRWQLVVCFEIATDTLFTLASKLQQNSACIGITKYACGMQLDSVLMLRFPIRGLRPNTTYFCRSQARGAFSDYGIEGAVSSIVTFTTATVSLPTIPALLPTQKIQHNEMTLQWQAASGFPEQYRVEVATDSAFRFPLTAFNNIAVRDTQVRITGLSLGTSYFYRIRSVNAQGQSALSAVGRERTLAVLPPLAAHRADSMVLPIIPQTPEITPVQRTFVTFASPQRLTFVQIDSLLTRFLAVGVVPDSLWVQSTAECTPNSATRTEIAMTLRSGMDKLTTFGLTQRQISWVSDCQCKAYRLYYNTTPVSVGEEPTNFNNPLTCTPNPASDEVRCTFALVKRSLVQVSVMDILGKPVLTINEGWREAGKQNISLDVQSLPQGVYFVRLVTQTAQGEMASHAIPLHVIR